VLQHTLFLDCLNQVMHKLLYKPYTATQAIYIYTYIQKRPIVAIIPVTYRSNDGKQTIAAVYCNQLQ